MYKYLLISLLFTSSVCAAPLPSPSGTSPFVATGTTSSRSAASRASDVINVRDFGAKCDGATDDSSFINAAVAIIRSRGTGTLSFAGCNTRITSTINMTGINSYSVTVDMTGGLINCATSGAACIDAFGSSHIRWRDLAIQGSQTNSPNIGLQKGRLANGDGYGGEFTFENPSIQGYFTLAALYNFSGETDAYFHPTFSNSTTSGSCYAVIQDAYNMFGVTSSFKSITATVGSKQSFNENSFFSPTIYVTNGSSCSPVWMGGTSRHTFSGGYIANFNSTGHEIFLYSDANNTTNVDLDMDVHFEVNPSDIFFITGPGANPVVSGMRYREHLNQATGSIIKTDTGISSVIIHNLDMHVAFFLNAPNTFSSPGIVTADGRADMPSSAWNLSTANFSGTTNLQGVYSLYGANTPSSYGSGLALASGVLSVSLPNPLQINNISAVGGLTSVSPSVAGLWSIPTGGTLFPTVTLSAPASGGTQAVIHFTNLLHNTLGSIVSGGAGYAVNDIFSPVGGTPYGPASQWRVTSVGGGGAITGYTPSGTGRYSSLIPDTVSVSTVAVTGSGSGATFHGSTWIMPATAATDYFAIDASGSGYSSGTAVFTSPAGVTLSGGVPAVNLVFNSNFTVTGGVGQILLDSVGTKLGTAGTSGHPSISLGALIDNSGVRQSLGATYSVPANTSLVRFTQTGTLAASSITLPTALVDGQPIQFVNYTGTITALTFSPPVSGWVNGSQLSSNTGLRVRWDSVAATWYREE